MPVLQPPPAGFQPGWVVKSIKQEQDGSMTRTVSRFVITASALALLPANGQQIEFRFRSGLPPSEAGPFFFEGKLGDFLMNYFAGNCGEAPILIRPDTAALALMTEWIRIIKTESEDSGQD